VRVQGRYRVLVYSNCAADCAVPPDALKNSVNSAQVNYPPIAHSQI